MSFTMLCPSDEIGRHKKLKISCSNGRVGSSPSLDNWSFDVYLCERWKKDIS